MGAKIDQAEILLYPSPLLLLSNNRLDTNAHLDICVKLVLMSQSMKERGHSGRLLLGLHNSLSDEANYASATNHELSTLFEGNEPSTPPKPRKRPCWSSATLIKPLKPLGASVVLIWKQTCGFVKLTWRRKWTAEICSYIVSVLSLAGLAATLVVHDGKPLPQWPQIVTINSIVSLLSLLMRASVGVVLAEGNRHDCYPRLKNETPNIHKGISQSKWHWFREPRPLVHMEQLDSASRGSWGSISLLCSLRPQRT